MDDREKFRSERAQRIAGYADNPELGSLSRDWLARSMRDGYVYNFDWAGLPIIQYPQDMVALQEIVWETRPDLIIETGIARGGSLALSASLLAMLDYCEAAAAGTPLDPRSARRAVIGIDIDIRPHNRQAIEEHPLSHKIRLVEGSSTAEETIAEVARQAQGFERVLVCLDSNHTHEHVLAELEAYAPLVTPGSYCIVFDTFVEDMQPGFFDNRPWDVGDNPRTAVRQYLSLLSEEGRRASDGEPLRFAVDEAVELKLGITVAPGGYLKRIHP
jgi:cephalosporin hydroxylase